jgi:hypothetical protein
VEALYAMYPPAGIAENYEWVKLFAKLTGMSMASKTVLSAASHVRNFAGNFLNLAASGNLGINDILNGGRYKKALDLTIRSTFSNASAQQFKDTIKELVELGVLNESLTAGLLNDLIGTKRVAQNPMEFSDRLVDMLVKKPAAAIWDNAQKSYQSGDEFFKVVIYLSELDKYRKAMPQWSEQQLKENAGEDRPRCPLDIQPLACGGGQAQAIPVHRAVHHLHDRGDSHDQEHDGTRLPRDQRRQPHRQQGTRRNRVEAGARYDYCSRCPLSDRWRYCHYEWHQRRG